MHKCIKVLPSELLNSGPSMPLHKLRTLRSIFISSKFLITGDDIIYPTLLINLIPGDDITYPTLLINLSNCFHQFSLLDILTIVKIYQVLNVKLIKKKINLANSAHCLPIEVCYKVQTKGNQVNHFNFQT